MFIMWKVSIDYDEILRYKQRKHRDLEDSDASEVNTPRRLENTVY